MYAACAIYFFSPILQVLAIEFITFATDFVPFTIEFNSFAVELVTFVPVLHIEINLTGCAYNQLQLPSSASSGILLSKNNPPCDEQPAASVVVMNYCVNVTDSNAIPTNSTVKPTNSIANGPDSIAKVMNSTANKTKSVAKSCNKATSQQKSSERARKIQAIEAIHNSYTFQLWIYVAIF